MNPHAAPTDHGIAIERWRGPARQPDHDLLAAEEPLEIRVNDLSLAITMRTPGRDEALAAGFLATEGLVRGPEDLLTLQYCQDPDHPDLRNILRVLVPPERLNETEATGRQRYASSSCGLCGRATIDRVLRDLPPPSPPRSVSAAVLYTLPGRLRAAQTVFERTGGLHAAGLFTLDGELVAVEEDIGRHNAVDKAIGRMLLEDRWPIDDLILMASGRAGFEIVQKAAAVGIPVVCSVSAPSTLAAELARRAGMILAGFLRGETMNAYAGADRVAP